MKNMLFIIFAIFAMSCSSDSATPESNVTPDPVDGVPASNVEYNVSNRIAQDYIFNGNGLTDAADPELTLVRGQVYVFNITVSGHPFFIKAVQTAGDQDPYNDGVQNNGAENSTVTFTVPMDAPDLLFYNCSFHPTMTGRMNIVD